MKHYYAHNGVEGGPVNMNELTQMVRNGQLNANDYVRSESQNYWTPIVAVKELAQHATASVPVGVPPLPPPITMTGTTSSVFPPPPQPPISGNQKMATIIIDDRPQRKSKSFNIQTWLTAALLVAVIVLAFLLFKRETPQNVAKQNVVPPPVAEHAKPMEEPVVEPEPAPEQNEEPQPTLDDSEEEIHDDPRLSRAKNGQEVDASHAGMQDESKPMDRPTVEDREELPVAPPVENAAPIAVTLEPIEATELRQQFEEAVKQAKAPYREELEKELALAKKQGELKLVLALEPELKHHNLEYDIKLTGFAPEKRSLFNAKARYKKQVETALDTYRKELDSLIRELVRTERINEAKAVQETLEYVGKPRMSETIPVRVATPATPVIKMMVEVDVNGKGWFSVTRGMTTDPYRLTFRGQQFPFSAFPKAQAFRGENGMGRVFFDFRNPDSEETWKNYTWRWNMRNANVDHQRRALSYETFESWNAFGLGRLGLPCRIIFEVAGNPGQLPTINLNFLSHNDKRWATASFWSNVSLAYANGNYRSKSNTEQKFFQVNAEQGQPLQGEFQLPKELLQDLKHIDWYNAINSNPPGGVDILLIDVTTRFNEASTGLTIKQQDEALAVEKIEWNSPARRAGLKVGDTIIRFNGAQRSVEEVQKILDDVNFGDPITIAVVRDGEEKVFRFHAE